MPGVAESDEVVTPEVGLVLGEFVFVLQASAFGVVVVSLVTSIAGKSWQKLCYKGGDLLALVRGMVFDFRIGFRVKIKVWTLPVRRRKPFTIWIYGWGKDSY